MSLEDKEVPQCSVECTEDFAKTRVSFRIPSRTKGPMQQQKNVLEQGSNKSSKNTTKRGLYTQSKPGTYSVVHAQHF
jgi:hypothetical protein